MMPPSACLPRRQADQLGHAGHRQASHELHHPQGRDLFRLVSHTCPLSTVYEDCDFHKGILTPGNPSLRCCGNRSRNRPAPPPTRPAPRSASAHGRQRLGVQAQVDHGGKARGAGALEGLRKILAALHASPRGRRRRGRGRRSRGWRDRCRRGGRDRCAPGGCGWCRSGRCRRRGRWAWPHAASAVLISFRVIWKQPSPARQTTVRVGVLQRGRDGGGEAVAHGARGRGELGAEAAETGSSGEARRR